MTDEVESRRIVLRKGRMESNLHIILKVLAYCFFWERNLIIEPHFRLNRFKPDLISWRPPEIPTQEKQIPDLWIECKHVKLKKLKKLSRALPLSQIVWINSAQSLTRTIKSIQSNKISPILASNIQLLGVETSKQNWESLQESIIRKKAQWGINKHSNNSMKINVRASDLDPIPLIFHAFPATIKT
ncbi:MAG: hypothetical protein ACFE8U_18215 [Candidatus Hermodarchaeota archaeon]